MKIVAVIFIFLAFSLAKILVLNEASETPVINFPTLDPPSFDPIDLSAGCSGFVDCTEYVGAVIYNLALGIIFLILFIIDLVLYIIQLFNLLLAVSFDGIEGAPFWINALFSIPFLAMIAFILYRLIRSGESAA